MSENKLNESSTAQPEKKISSIHTLESDLASAVMDNNYGKNIIKIVTDPKNNSTFDTDFDKKSSVGFGANIFTKRNVVILIIIIFIISSVSIILYILYKSKNVEIDENKADLKDLTTLPNSSNDVSLDTQQPVVTYNNVLNPEILKSSDFSKLDRVGVVSEINKIKQLLLDSSIAPNNNVGINSNLNITQLFEKIRYSGDEALLRSFGETYALGLYSREGKYFENYLLIEISNFDLAFKSILGWEKYIPIDLKDIFIGNNEIVNTVIATTTSSSSSAVIEKKYYKNNTKVFVDRVLKNYDIREYVDNESNINIVYGFINNKYLLITSGDQSFLDIKNRLLKENISR